MQLVPDPLLPTPAARRPHLIPSPPPVPRWVIFNDSRAPVASVSYERYGELLLVHWHGNSTADGVREAANVVLHLARRHGHSILSDGSGSDGTWAELLPWLQYDYLPRLATLTAVRQIAFVGSAQAQHQLLLRELATASGALFRAAVFADVGQAREWLRQPAARPLI